MVWPAQPCFAHALGLQRQGNAFVDSWWRLCLPQHRQLCTTSGLHTAPALETQLGGVAV
jgi:hypothetical protein